MKKNFIKEREKEGLTQAELAKELGIPAEQLVNFEEGTSKKLFTDEDLEKIAAKVENEEECEEMPDLGEINSLGREIIRAIYKSMLGNKKYSK